ncbi:MAG: hypothetical protein ACYCSN_18165 [Acidobacteriaceae bacterium]
MVGTRKDDGSLAATELKVCDPWRVDEANPLVRKSPPRIPWFRVLNSLSGGPLRGKLAGGSFLEEPPEIIQTKNEPIAKLWVNGFPLQMTKTTAISMVARDIDRNSMVRIGRDNLGMKPAFPWLRNRSPLTFPASGHLIPGIYLAYKGTQQAGGSILANSFIIFPSVAPKPMTKDVMSLAPQITEPDYVEQSPGSIRYRYGDAIQIVPERAVHEYVRSVGMELIPSYQKTMGSSAPTKINFRFYVVHPFNNLRKNGFIQIDGRKTPPVNWRGSNWRGLDSPFVLPMDNSQVDRIVEMPDGVILIPDRALTRLRNKAQLAFALSIAVQSIVQRQEYMAVGAMRYGTGETAMPPKGISYMETMLSLRLAIRQMYLVGYDIREAPFAWKYERGQQVNNPVINSTHPDSDFPWYAAYAFNYISQYYKDVDYSKLKKGEAEYQQFLEELRKTDPQAFAKQ